MGVLADHDAARMLTPSMAAVVALVKHLPYGVRANSLTLAGLAARVAWFDDQVVRAVASGMRQVVLVGAGYDTRAWRFRDPRVRFFEMDTPETQRDKVRRAPAPAPAFIEVDLNVGSIADALRTSSFDTTLPAHFVMEGVTMYLREAVLRRQLTDLSTVAASGSRLAVDFSPPAAAGNERHRRQLRLQRLTRIGSGEGFRLLVDRAQAVDLVAASGWDVTEHVSLRHAAHQVIDPGSGLPLDAINEHKTLIVAVPT
jgi:methyltransferase (TIGR00027 family)